MVHEYSMCSLLSPEIDVPLNIVRQSSDRQLGWYIHYRKVQNFMSIIERTIETFLHREASADTSVIITFTAKAWGLEYSGYFAFII